MAFHLALSAVENVTFWFTWTYVVTLTAAVIHGVVWPRLSLAARGSIGVVLLDGWCFLPVVVDDLIQGHLRVGQHEVTLSG